VSARVLIVEDEPLIAESVAYALRRERFAVDVAAEGHAALEAARGRTYDLVILDLTLPDLSGLDVCRRLRAESAVPIIMLTARGAELDRVVGLEVGADDYVTKPFSAAELVARVRALLRRRELDRAEAAAGPPLQIGGIRIDPVGHEVRVEARPVHLTPSEFKVLALLAERPGQVVTRLEIIERLWGTSHVGAWHTCDVHVSNLRRKLERDPARPERIVTVRGFGYKLVPA
jgi:two-component system response regulator RegX3